MSARPSSYGIPSPTEQQLAQSRALFLEGIGHFENGRLEPARLWEEAGDLGYLLARKGVSVKTLDLMITVYALAADVPILTGDGDFKHIRNTRLTHLRLA